MSEITRFISDLHLSEATPKLTALFFAYLERIQGNTKQLYILGDLFEVWLGDDVCAAFEQTVALKIRALAESGCEVFFLPGNRDFLLGERYCQQALMTLLPDPSVLLLDRHRLLLAHGDAFCTLDKSHQRFRRLTNQVWVKRLFLTLPKRVRVFIASRIRAKSQSQDKGRVITDVVKTDCLQALKRHGCQILIHGHTHRPEQETINTQEGEFLRIVLSDWRETETELWYSERHGFDLIL